MMLSLAEKNVVDTRQNDDPTIGRRTVGKTAPLCG
jgi:hypothetical protein